MTKPIVHQQFMRSVIKWMAQADDGLIQRFCTTMVLENPALARKVYDLIAFAEKVNTKPKRKKDEENE